ncbi:histidine phosphatase family protein [Ileibacterium valens]|uniref:histidine phosphatase family protein n=1 Tax=Ileibacterium valens TaxID=1862668 RepID=UPI00259B1402|nr:histidine phosphatase family protein [Ileibacterium valens]
MKIIMIRHGETDWNTRNQVQGASDIPLNEKGIAQAKEAGRKMKDQRIDKIFSSPLIRARQTSEQIANEHETPIEVIIEPTLAEQNFGVFEGQPRDDQTYQHEKHLFFKRFEKGESFFDVAARVYPFLDRIIEEYPQDAVLLLSCHGGILRMIASYFSDLDNEEFTEYFALNCEQVEFEIDKNKWIQSKNRWKLKK